MKSILKLIYYFFKIEWGSTILFNFLKLPISEAIHLPILLYNCRNRFDLLFSSGKIYIGKDKKNIRFGMIKLGINVEKTLTEKTGIVIINNGNIFFEGATIIGNGSSIKVFSNAKLIIGSNCGFTGNLKIQCKKNITIGKGLSCSWNVVICDTNFHECIDVNKNKLCQENIPITIGNYVWICQNVEIMKGSEIPDDTTIASFTMTNKKYKCAAYSVIAGIPGNIIENKKLKRTDLFEFKSSETWILTKGIKPYSWS